MQPNEFCYWLQGFFERNGTYATLNDSQIAVVKEHLQLVTHRETLKETTNVVIPQSPTKRKGPFEDDMMLYCSDGGPDDPSKVPSPLSYTPNWERSF